MRIKLKLTLISLLLIALTIVGTQPVSANFWGDFKHSLTSIFDTTKQSASSTSSNAVLGNAAYQNQSPAIYINGEDNHYTSGGLITQATTDEAAIYLSGYRIPRQLEIRLYKASQADVLSYLLHDKDAIQLNKNISTDTMQYQGTVAIDTTGYSDGSGSKRYTLPISGTGVWYLELKGENVATTAFVLRSDHGVVVTEGDNELVYWAQDYQSLRKKTGGSLKLYNFLNNTTELASTTFDDQGLAKTLLTDQADVAISQFGDDFAILPINLTYLNTGYGYAEFRPRTAASRYFTFTDRPLYMPGDTVHFKSIIRDDQDASYTIPTGLAYVTLTPGDEKNKIEKSFPISPDGTISGDFDTTDFALGYYSLTVMTSRDKSNSAKNSFTEYTGVSDYSSTSFQIEHYRKPELFLSAENSAPVVTAGTPLKFAISGEYFAGLPLSGENLTYKVTAADYYEYSYLTDAQNTQVDTLNNDYRYGAWYGSHDVATGTLTLDKKGMANLEVDTNLNFSESGAPQVFMLEVSLEGGEQDAAFVRKNVLVKAGRFSLYATEYLWGVQKGQSAELPLRLMPNDPTESISSQNIDVTVTRRVWNKEIIASEKYPRYTEEVFELPSLAVQTDQHGRALLKFTPTELGSYTLQMSAKDSVGNTVKKEFLLYVSDSAYPSYNPTTLSEDLSFTSLKDTYNPGEIAKLTLSSNFKNRDVLLTIDRGYTHRYEVLSLEGSNQIYNLSLQAEDQPNIFVTASSFSTSRLDVTSLPLKVSTLNKKMQIDLKSDRSKYGPGDTVVMDLTTTDSLGNPVSGEVALWSVDKALYELMDSRLGNIFETFWSDRVNSTASSHSLKGILVQVAERGGGCFLPGTQVAMADGTKRNIENVSIGDWVQTYTSNGRPTSARVSATHTDYSDGYITVNNQLKVTPDHLIYANGTWRQAGSLVPGDYLKTEDGAKTVDSTFYQAGKVKVYNLTIDHEHTFIADDVWVHNDKGMERSSFKDVAYWNPSIRTNSSGKAQISFKLPDNLTTWTMSAVGNNNETVVGQSQLEITTTKDIILKPILPNIVRSGDELSVSAIARNFTNQDDSYTFAISVEGAELLDSPSSVVTIKSLESVQNYWKLKPTPSASVVKIKMSVISRSDEKKGDVVIQEIPIIPFGFHESNAQVGTNDTRFELTLPQDALNANSHTTLSLAPSVITSLQPAMQYLIHYPYGCVEQLTSSTVPALIAARYPDLFPDINKGSTLDTYIKAGLTKIIASHDSFSGWGWWSHAPVTPFVTSYVLEALVDAKNQGYEAEVKDAIVDATNYLSRPQNEQGQQLSDMDKAITRYGLSLVGKANNFPKPSDLSSLSDDVLAMAIIGNFAAGDKNPDSNGLALLVSRAQKEGNTLYWKAGDYDRFGSIDASTAWAIRAIIAANGDREIAVAGANYLINVRRSNYWSNTYGTVITARALFDLFDNNAEANPSYNYSVTLDGKVLKQGKLSDVSSAVADIEIPLTQAKHIIEIKKDGLGQLYSNLVTNLYRTDSKANAVSNGLTLSRTYTNAKNPDYNISLGDIVDVELHVSGDLNLARQGVIEDQLPSGMIPINESFKNEQANINSNYDYWSTKQYTQNGVIIAAGNLRDKTYSYKARVVSMGTFQIPPATTELMYAPEINARTEVDTLTISSESKLLPGKALEAALKKITMPQYLVSIGLIIAAIGASFFLYRRYRSNLPDSVPPTPLPPSPHV